MGIGYYLHYIYKRFVSVDMFILGGTQYHKYWSNQRLPHHHVRPYQRA